MIGAYIMTQANCEGKATVEDGIAMAAYTMDSHNCQRIVVEKDGVRMVKNEGNVEVGGFGPYPISYRAITPKERECVNLLVPVCLSASHIAYGSIRMEPVFMVLAQSSAIAASLAIDKKIPVQKLDAKAIRKMLKENPLLDGSQPDVVVDDADKARVVVTGQWRKLTGRSYGPSMLVSGPQTNSAASVRFRPLIEKAGAYSVYAYFPRVENMAAEVRLVVYDGKQAHGKMVRPNEIKVVGQTSGEWVYLGDFNFSAPAGAYVDVLNKGATGTVVADAILLKKTSK
jgi:hypothetical protein